MTAPQLRDAFLQQWKLVITCTLGAALAAFVVSSLITPLYQSTTVVHAVVSPAVPNAYSLLVLNTLVGTEAQIAVSKPIMDRVAARYMNLSGQELRQEVTVKADQNTQLFEITVLDPSPTRAAALANDIAATLILNQKQAFLDRNAQAEQKISGEITTIKATITTLTDQLHSSSTTPSQAADIQAQLDAAKEQYTQLVDTLSQLQGNDAQYAIVLRVAVVAEPDSRPVRPVLLVNIAIGLACGFLLGVLLVLLRAQLDQRLSSADEVATLLETPVLAASASRASSGKGKSQHAALATDTTASDLVSTLQESVDFLAVERPIRSIAVVGILDSSSTADLTARWAVSLALHGQRTLLVDASLQHPVLHGSFGVSREHGLTDAVLAASKSSDSMPPVNSFFQTATTVEAPYLVIMTAGAAAPNASALLRTRAMGMLFDSLLASGADAILFHLPAALDRIDASPLQEHVDAVVLVVERSRLRKSQLLRAKARLQRDGARVVGCVVVEQGDTFTPQRAGEQSLAQLGQLTPAVPGHATGAPTRLP